WDEISFLGSAPVRDKRSESTAVIEGSIQRTGRKIESHRRAELLRSRAAGSAKSLLNDGRSLGVIAPKNTKFFWKKKSNIELDGEREIYRDAARQLGIFDAKLPPLEPTPYTF